MKILGRTIPIGEARRILSEGRSEVLQGFRSKKGTLFAAALKSKPALHKRDCVGCGLCKNVCPANAIVIKDKKAVIDRSLCIRCFCCQEFCPKSAMIVKRPLLAKIASKL